MGFLRSASERRISTIAGDEEAIAVENEEAEKRGAKADEGGAVLFIGEPLLHENGNEKRRHRKINALGAEGENCARKRAEHTAPDPIQVIEE